jgi:pimeloyl-ACP methyl ester carboxylesterase
MRATEDSHRRPPSICLLRRTTRTLVCLSAAALIVLAASHAVGRAERNSEPTAAARACPSGLGSPWRCSTVWVPLDRSGAVSGGVQLAVALLHRPGPPRPAVVALAGGPGSAAIPAAIRFRKRLGPLLAHRDLLVFDQRGTGSSGRIRCPTIDVRSAWTPAEVRQCAAHLGPGRAFEGTDDSVADLEDVRTALGIPKLTVYGISYGTKVAVDYARMHPQTVDRMVLDSPIVEDTDPYYRRSAVGATRILRNQCAEGWCVHGFDPAVDLRKLVARMQDGVLPADRRITEARILHTIVSGGSGLHRLPGRIHLALLGHPGPLADALPVVVPDSRDDRWLRPSRSRTVYLTTSCEDGDFPWPRPARPAQRRADSDRELARLGDRAFAPFDHWVGQQYGAVPICAPWPEAGARPAPPPVPDVPTLLLVGGDDDIAPLEGAREIAAEIPHSSIVTIPDWGHGVLEDDPPAESALARWATRHPG